MRTVFIINPLAGNGNSIKKWRRFKKGISFPFEEIVTQYAGHAIQIASSFENSQEEVLLIGFGGDGTLREIIAGAAGNPQVIVGSVAAGSGNDFSRGFQSFRTGQDIQIFLQNPKAEYQDLGEFKDEGRFHFVSSSGIGFDAEVSFLVNGSLTKVWLNRIRAGKLVYLLYVIKTLIKFERFDLEVVHEGKSLFYRDVWLATVSNQPYFGGGMAISPDSKTDDGLLELTVVHGISRKKLLYVFRTVFKGTHMRFREVAHMSGKEFSLVTDRSVYRHVDGDYAGKTEQGKEANYFISERHWKSIIYNRKRM
jgi:diacylglycerol kinase (ATP)